MKMEVVGYLKVRVIFLDIHIHVGEYRPLRGTSYIKLPPFIALKKAVIDLKNKDQECFKWCVSRFFNLHENHPERISTKLQKQSEKFNWSGISFPVELSDISKFEKQNADIAVHVYGFEKDFYPLRISEEDERKFEIDLLLISEGENKHYCLIKNMSRLFSSQY